MCIFSEFQTSQNNFIFLVSAILIVIHISYTRITVEAFSMSSQ